MIDQFFLPPVILAIFIGIAWFIKKIGEWFVHDDRPQKGAKYKHYACGHDMEPIAPQMRYHSFFRTTWLFGLLHLGILVLATIALHSVPLGIVILSLVCISFCIWILSEEE